MTLDKETLEKQEEVIDAEVSEQPDAETNKSAKKTILGKSKKDKSKKKTQDKLQNLQKDLDEMKEKYLRLFAEFDNYKKRNIKERMELINSAAKNTLTALLPILDDFDRAKKSADDDRTQEVFSEGVALVYKRLYSVLDQQGLEPMESTGEPFDPELHEAISEIPVTDEDQKGIVIDTIEKGYLLNDKIIRYAKVVVGK